MRPARGTWSNEGREVWYTKRGGLKLQVMYDSDNVSHKFVRIALPSGTWVSFPRVSTLLAPNRENDDGYDTPFILYISTTHFRSCIPIISFSFLFFKYSLNMFGKYHNEFFLTQVLELSKGLFFKANISRTRGTVIVLT